ncbi:hypothetical protein BVC80_1487g11 [Macleaya cordata]|uniref:Uncharacterized protein n=1 Tax=Macleaya cordata TaxID=56857 RepID=A0A200QNI7_MACCD|nr:hypothetical protein BVC80_1487g11 [Macleaya cordata]
MNYVRSKLGMEKSCSCIAMVGIQNWYDLGSRSIGRLGQNRYMASDEFTNVNYIKVTTHASTPRWRVLWRRINKEKKRIFRPTSTPIRVAYDPSSYLKNFDEGSACSEADDIVSRSFTARFVDPSRISQSN